MVLKNGVQRPDSHAACSGSRGSAEFSDDKQKRQGGHMLYINQNYYSDMKYPTHTAEKDHPSHANSVADAGCGLCSVCMMVDRLCMEEFTLEQCRDVAVECKANWSSGTDMTVLGPVIAEKFALDYKESNNIEEAEGCLRDGGCVIMNAGGDYAGHVGIFTAGGHYVCMLSVGKNGEYCILDPALKEGKFDREGRRGKVRVEGEMCFVSAEIVAEETANRDPGYYLFRRKSDIGDILND